MPKNIQTHNAKVDLIKKFLNYANIADASYAMLHWIDYVKQNDEDEYDNGDTQKLGSTYNNQNSTYARAIEARFSYRSTIQ